MLAWYRYRLTLGYSFGSVRPMAKNLAAEMSEGTCCTTLGKLGRIEDVQNTHRSNPMPVLRANLGTRRKREFTPDAQKDSNYWLKRNRNNEAAKRSRQRKRLEEYILETRAFELQCENEKLKVALAAVNHRGSDLNNHSNVGFKYPLGMPNAGGSRSFHVPSTLIPLHGVLHGQFSGPMCAQTSHSNSVDLISFYGPENAVDTKTLSRIDLLDCYPISRYSDRTNECPREVYLSNRIFSYENNANQMFHYSNPMVSLSRISNCYRSRTSSSDTTLDCTLQPGLNGTAHEVQVETIAPGDTLQQKTDAQSFLLPHKLRYKVNNARFVTKCLS